MKEDIRFNTDFVRAVQARPCIYDVNHEGYYNKAVQDDAWNTLSAEMKGSVDDCKTRWKSLRASLSRYLKCLRDSGGNKCKPYYLTGSMQFLLPHLKGKKKLCSDERDSMSNIAGEYGVHLSESNDHENNDTSYSSDACDSLGYTIEEMPSFVDPNLVIDSHKEYSNIEPTMAGINKYENKSTKDHNNYSLGSSFTFSELDFFKSILPDIISFSLRKKRQFKQQILFLIDKLDGPSNNNTRMTHLENGDVADPLDENNLKYGYSKSSSSQESENQNSLFFKVEENMFPSIQGDHAGRKRKRTSEGSHKGSDEVGGVYSSDNTSIIASMDFFKSIIPDISNFTAATKREFKRGILQLIDELE